MDGANMTIRWTSVLVHLFGVFKICTGYKYLFVPVLLDSHVIEQAHVARELLSRGHEVHMVAPEVFPRDEVLMETGIKLLRAVRQDGSVFKSAFLSDDFSERFGNILLHENPRDRATSLELRDLFRAQSMSDCATMLADVYLLAAIETENYDAVLVDGSPDAPCSALLPYYMGIPFFSMSTRLMSAGCLPTLPSFVPMPTTQFSDRMTFLERVTNFLSFVIDQTLEPLSLGGYQDLLEKFPDPDDRPAQSWHQLQMKSSLFFTTRNHLLDTTVPSMPYYIMLPGVTQQPAKPLDRELEEYMTSARTGVILVSFGLMTKTISPSLIKRLYTAFRAHPDLRFLVRLSESDLNLQGDVPPNVRLMTWLPQNDVLGHENTRGFITHCGNNGQHEAVYHGVPMIGIPIFGDQFRNCRQLTVKTLGVCLDTNHFTPGELSDAINLVLEEETIKYNLEVLSSVMREDELPAAKVAYWIEHATKYGVEHLSSGAVDLAWYEYWMLDVLGGLACVTSLLVWILVRCMRCLCRIQTSKKAKHD